MLPRPMWLLPSIAVAGLTLMALARGVGVLGAVGKLVASTAMVAAGISWGGLETRYGIVIVVGLGLSWLGDAALIANDKRWFLAGLGVFLLAHVAYAVAFLQLFLDLFRVALAAIGAAVLAFFVLRWLLPHAGRMRNAVVAYVVVICAMMSLAVGGSPIIAAGALLFGASDLFVARHRFIRAEPINRIAGLPLYYAGQFLLAWSVTAPVA